MAESAGPALARAQTLLDGITVGGRKISDEQQVLNLADAANELLRLVKTGEFRLDKEVSDRLQYLIARDDALKLAISSGGWSRDVKIWAGAGRGGLGPLPRPDRGLCPRAGRGQ